MVAICGCTACPRTRTKHEVAQHASRQRAHALPLQLLIHELAIAGQRPAVNVQDEHPLPKLLLESRLPRQLVGFAILVNKGGGIDRVENRTIEGLYDGRHGSIVGGEGDIVAVRVPVADAWLVASALGACTALETYCVCLKDVAGK